MTFALSYGMLLQRCWFAADFSYDSMAVKVIVPIDNEEDK